MPYSVCERLNMGPVKFTSVTLQIADRTIKHPMGILEDVPVRVGQFFIPVDFIVLDIVEDTKIPIIWVDRFYTPRVPSLMLNMVN